MKHKYSVRAISTGLLLLIAVAASMVLPQAAAGRPAGAAEDHIPIATPASRAAEPTPLPLIRGGDEPERPTPAPQQAPAAQPEQAVTAQPPISTAAPGQVTPGPAPDNASGTGGEPPLPDLPPPPPPDGGKEEEKDSTPGFRPPRCNAAAPLENPPRFLALPFPYDPQMEVFHGWQYTHNKQPQCGIDYGKRNEYGLVGFPVLASADGEACADTDATGSGCVSGFGHRVLIRHTVDDKTYYTYYGHLETIAPEIPIGSRSDTVRVRRGQVIGFAGDTGTYGGSIHLHYGIASPQFGWYDPYDLWTTAHIYPDPVGSNGFLAGPNYFWLTNPPTFGAKPVGGPQASVPADAMTAGLIDISEWTHILGRQSGVVEIWIDGQLRGEANFGPQPGGGDVSIFSWEWDTSRERNGPHIVKLRAFGEDSRMTPLLSATGTQEVSFLISVQNPIGFVTAPPPGMVAAGTLPITGWVTVEDASISEVEIWIDGIKRGAATYGLPHAGAGGDFGFSWEWDTTRETDGMHTIIVKAFASNGGSRELPWVYNVEQRAIVVELKNWASMHKWVAR